MTPAQVLELVASSPERGQALRQVAMTALSELSGYDWCGIYRLEGDILVLDAFVGAPTDHTQIPIGVGVCGTAVKEGKNQVISDVRELDNYLSCSTQTRSEIVVLIEREGVVLGQIDIDGHDINRFTGEDEEFLTQLAALLAANWDEA